MNSEECKLYVDSMKLRQQQWFFVLFYSLWSSL